MPPRSTTDHSVESRHEDKVEEEPPVHAESPTINECDQSPSVETITPPCTTEIPTTPIMGNHGELWCDVNRKNIIEGRRLR